MSDSLKNHPMAVNVNTRIRWHVLSSWPEFQNMTGRRVLDVACGLGYFSAQCRMRGASVLATDVDEKTLAFVQNTYGVPVVQYDAEKAPPPAGPFDLIFVGEILEHVVDPESLIKNLVGVLAVGGVLVVTTPALEGRYTLTDGKRLGHTDGPERHERDGFLLEELESLADRAGVRVTRHAYSVHNAAELFMQTTKRRYLKARATYLSQADVLQVKDHLAYQALRWIFPVLFRFFTAEQWGATRLGLQGHCHVLALTHKKALAHGVSSKGRLGV